MIHRSTAAGYGAEPNCRCGSKAVKYGNYYAKYTQKHTPHIQAMRLVYVIVWVTVVFGINCANNAGRKLVIVLGA